ncbi:MAG: methylmalonyl-CoA mutase family protein, partial [Nitrososphaerales archaeon]
LRALRRRRDARKVKLSLKKLREAFDDPDANSMEAMLEAVKANATLQEIMDVGREAFGGWKEPLLA